jgi:hypothetical protein
MWEEILKLVLFGRFVQSTVLGSIVVHQDLILQLSTNNYFPQKHEYIHVIPVGHVFCE